ncbi:MAG: hypothetical protein ABW096_09075 [Candidatus Thiodiazotropha sp.]
MFNQCYLLKYLVVIFVLLSQTACVSTMSRPTADASSPASIHAVDFVPSDWDLPLGAKVVAESNLVVRMGAGPSNAALFGAMLFGPIGAVVLNSSMSADTEEATKGMASFAELRLKDMATEVLEETHKNGQMPTALTFSGNVVSGDVYKLQPFIYIETDGSNRSDLMLMLRITKGDGKWTGQYVSHMFGLAEVKQIHYSEEFREAVKTTMRQSLKIFYQDIEGALVKDEEYIVPSVAKSMLFSQGPLWGWELKSPNDDLFVFHAKLNPGQILGGVHIFNAEDVTTKPFVEKNEDTSDSIVTTNFR